MERDEAARLLGVRPDASRPEVEKAFQHMARLTHPDLVPAERAEAARVQFQRIEAARRALLTPAVGGAATAAATAAPAGAAPVDPYGRRRFDAPTVVQPPMSTRLVVLWSVLLLATFVLAHLRSDAPLTLLDPVLRGLALEAGLTGWALTGNRRLLVLGIVALIATVITVTLFATIVGLMGTLLMAPAVIGLLGAGQRRHVLRMRASR